MLLEDKREFAMNFIRLGLDPYAAMVQTDCTPEEITALEEDPRFQSDVAFEKTKCELDLLEKLELAIDIGVVKGNASAVQWKLERINKRWQNNTVQVEGNVTQNHLYLPENGR